VVTGAADEQGSAKLRVDEVYRGNVPKLVTAQPDLMCGGPAFVAGRQYLLYQRIDDPNETLLVGGCGRSGDAADRQDELAFLRSFSKGETPTRIYGRVDFDLDRMAENAQEYDAPRPAKDIGLIVTNGASEYRTKTNALGEYEVREVTPGRYQVLLEANGYQAQAWKQEFTVEEHACYQQDFNLTVDRRVHGTVTDADGMPVSKVLVAMKLTDPKVPIYDQQILIVETAQDGTYTIEGIYPGSYYLGVNVRNTPQKSQPHPATYYPGTTEQRLASPIIFTKLPASYELNFRLPKPLPLIKVQGRVVKEKGASIGAGEQVFIRVRDTDDFFDALDEDVTVDDEGRFEFEVCVGIPYTIFAFTNADQELETETVTFTPTEKNHAVQLVLRPIKRGPE
jgi:hypothetical protein